MFVYKLLFAFKDMFVCSATFAEMYLSVWPHCHGICIMKRKNHIHIY